MNKNLLILIIVSGTIISVFGGIEFISYLEWKEIGGQYFDDPQFQKVMKSCKKNNSIFNGGPLIGFHFGVNEKIITNTDCKWESMTEEEIIRFQKIESEKTEGVHTIFLSNNTTVNLKYKLDGFVQENISYSSKNHSIIFELEGKDSGKMELEIPKDSLTAFAYDYDDNFIIWPPVTINEPVIYDDKRVISFNLLEGISLINIQLFNE